MLGPPRSGKTTGVAIPNVLAAPGRGGGHFHQTGPAGGDGRGPSRPSAAAGCSTRAARSPSPAGVTRLRWSPVASAATWDESLVLARAMAGAARPDGRVGDSAHWTERAEALLAPLLHAAHLAGPAWRRSCGGCFARTSNRPGPP